MSDGSLSQDEIDALLQGSGGIDLGEPEEPAAAQPQRSAAGPNLGVFTEFLREVSESQASNLTSLVGSNVRLGEPAIEIISNGTFVKSLPLEVVQIVQNFAGGAAGSHSYLFAPDIATAIAGMMMGQEEVELNEAALTALSEAGNTLAGATASALSERIGAAVSAEPGETRTKAAGDVEVPDGRFVKVTYSVSMEGKESAELVELFDMAILNQFGQAAQTPAVDESADSLFAGGGDLDDSLFGGTLAQPHGGMSGGRANPNVQSVQFPALSGGAAATDQGNISLLMDVYMEMTVELGRTRRLIRDILGMGEGTILELDKLAGEPVDILVNQKLIAKGEVVVIDENFGVRVTEIVDPMERVSEM
ncbi:MAG: flagellar motor switch protein FliN [Spirochaetales bacterium]|nr:flagellar motor switch protein FliN [Spirochaetales bacterium]